MADWQPNIGDEVYYRGHKFRVLSVKLGGIAGPHCRLTPLDDDCPEDIAKVAGGLTSVALLLPIPPK